MLSTALQLWGGVFYLLNKIFFSFSERNPKKQQQWRIWSWAAYIIGLPAWVAIFVAERNWIAASMEAGGAPSMILGLIIAIRGKGKDLKWLDILAFVAVVLGLGYSLYDFGGLTTLNQLLELGIVTGFLVGTYLLAKERYSGYGWLLLMNASNAVLMARQDYVWLTIQQLLSLLFIADAIIQRKKGFLTAPVGD